MKKIKIKPQDIEEDLFVSIKGVLIPLKKISKKKRYGRILLYGSISFVAFLIIFYYFY